jgi:predicted branched-subunit amino acid permease
MSLEAPAWRDPNFVEGCRDMAAIGLGVAAWGLITGVAMIKSGLTIPLALLMSLTVFAGSAQLAALPLIASGAPVWVVWATALCVNLRFIIFSAQWRPYFGKLPRAQRLRIGYLSADLNYVVFMRRYPEPRPAEGQVAYFWGGAITAWLSWQIPSIAGIALADVVPTHWGLGFAGTLALLGLVCSMLTDRGSRLTAVVAGSAAVAAFALPFKLNILVAIAAAVAVGVMADRRSPPDVKAAA